MGIRYYASPVLAADVEIAQADPRAFMCCQRAAERQDALDYPPRSLYLDKCWRQLQDLLGPTGDQPARPSFQLVEGQVTNTSRGWDSFRKVLSPEQVLDVARDLALIGEQEVLAARVREFGGTGVINDDPDELRYVMQYLDDAKAFVAELAEENLGLIYTIG